MQGLAAVGILVSEWNGVGQAALGLRWLVPRCKADGRIER